MARRDRYNREGEKVKVTRETLRRAIRIFRYMKPYRVPFALGMIFLILTGGVAVVFPRFIGDLVDATSETTPDQVNYVAKVLVVVLFAQAVFSFFRIYLFTYVTQNTLAAVRQDAYRKLITMPMSFFSTRRVGELNSRVAADVSLLQETFSTTIAEFLRQVIIIIGGIAFLFYISATLTLFMLAVVPIMALAAVFFGRFIRKLSRKAQDQVAESNTVVEETLQGITNVKSFTNEAFEIARYGKAIREAARLGITGGRWRGGFASFIVFCIFGSIVAVIWRGSLMVQDASSDFTNGQLFSFVLYTVFIGASIGGIANLYSSIQSAIGATDKLMDILEEEGEKIEVDQTEKASLGLKGQVEFSNVSFSYPSRDDIQVLHDVSFKAHAGEQIALVGPSGAGKSTIASLLMRFYDVSSGSIKIDETTTSDYALTDLRSQIAIVPQEVLLFGGTIKENIEYGKPGASDDEIEEAARKANALQFINDFPEKMETIVGERGVQLSGGQRQRIAIARAVLKDPAILILDEATSSLDSESEVMVQEALDKLMQGRTSFVIAHRLSTIRNSDRILVIEGGRLKESGTHDELIANTEGTYYNLSKLQFEQPVSS